MKLEEGSEHEFKIIKMNHDEKKVGLSLRGIGEQASKREVEAYKPPASSSTTTLGDLLNLKRAKQRPELVSSGSQFPAKTNAAERAAFFCFEREEFASYILRARKIRAHG